MNRWAAALVVGTLLVCVRVSAQQVSDAPQASFRAGVELVQLDVSVLDKNRHPIAGLSASDFTVLVDGKPRTVVAFKAVELPPPLPPPSTPWMREVPPDVATNVHPTGRVIAILVDDYSFGVAQIGPGGVKKARQIVRSVIDELTPDDRAAVLFAANGHSAQGFTTDRRLLTAAIETSAAFGEPDQLAASDTGAGPISNSDQNGYCYCGACSLEALANVTAALRDVPEQRKILMFISAGSVVQIPEQPRGGGPESECNRRKRDALHDSIRNAQLANATIQSVDPSGLDLGRLKVSGFRPANNIAGPNNILRDDSTRRTELLRSVSEATGGRAVLNNNDMERQVPGLLAESSTYYLLGIERPAAMAPDRFHSVKVRVNKAGLDVRTRSGFYEPGVREQEVAADLGESRDVMLSIAAPVPRSDFPLDITAAPFASAGGSGTVAVAVRVKHPAGGDRAERVEDVDVVAGLYNPESGREVRLFAARMAVNWRPTDASFGEYELVAPLDAPPGRYELRVGLKTGTGQTASAYTYVEVPRFDGDLAVSGLVLSATTPPVATAGREALGDLLPVAPTARRVFRHTDNVMAFVRAYRPGPSPDSVVVTTRVTDTASRVVFESVDRPVSDASPPGVRADHLAVLPIASLAAGEYLLSVDVRTGTRSTARALRFRIE